MACPRCGSRMLSRSGSSRRALVCSDCGTPHHAEPSADRPHPLTTAGMLLSMGAFSLLLFFLTNWRVQPAQQTAGNRTMIHQITIGSFAQDEPALEASSRSEEANP